jgi:hypothetical protein
MISEILEPTIRRNQEDREYFLTIRREFDMVKCKIEEVEASMHGALAKVDGFEKVI